MINVALFLVAAIAQPDPNAFAVHEWGTFNQFDGGDGIEVDGLQHEDEPLPDFVHRRLTRTPSPFRVYGDDSARVRARHASSKMETPVIYFHSSIARHVHVDVTWTRGLLTEWYPATARIDPEKRELTDPDVRAIRSSSLGWDVDVLPNARAHFERVADEEPWSLARDVDANTVVDKKSGEAERYLFYRGIGAQTLALRVVLPDDTKRFVVNATGKSVPDAVIVEVAPDGRGVYGVLGPIAAGALATFDASTAPTYAHDDLVAKLQSDVAKILVARGLNEDEAQAMVKTWTTTWFVRPGRRVLAIVPAEIVDEALPLTIDPKPTSLVRVMVARVEYETHADQTALIDAATHNDRKTLAQRGRFLEPELRVALRSLSLDDARDIARAHAIDRVLRELAADDARP